jgi:hypothetical protein
VFGSTVAAPPFKVHDVGARDDGDPTDEQLKEIARLVAQLPGQLGRERPHGSSASYGPR